MNLGNRIIEILKREVVPAIGCTEPVSVALACAKARELLNNREVRYIEVLVSPNIYKNGLAVGVPNTGEVGLDIAGALGFVAGNSKKGLQVLSSIDKKEVELAKALLRNDKLLLDLKDTQEKVYVEVIAHGYRGNHSRVIIKNKHDEFVYLESEGEVIKDVLNIDISRKVEENNFYNTRIGSIIEEIEKISYEDLDFLLEGFNMNEKIATFGLENKSGMGVGYTLYKNIKKGILSDDIMNHAKMLTAAASDVRMSGVDMPVMSSNGSGNNGLTAILPIVAYQNKFPTSYERLARALAISHIMNSYVKYYIGRLSALCGCGVAAGVGAGAALTWLMGGNIVQIEGSIKNILGDISGMICDGAKVGCALKLSTSASVAVQGALLAMDNQIIPAGNGIVAETVEETIKNLHVLSTEGMKTADGAILSVMRKSKSMISA